MNRFFNILLLGLFIGTPALAKEVLFEIPLGTLENEWDWNRPESPVMAEVGDTLTIINNDESPHRLHTDGRPCPHGDVIEPGESWSCELTSTYNALEEDKPTRGHSSYLTFWIIVTEAP